MLGSYSPGNPDDSPREAEFFPDLERCRFSDDAGQAWRLIASFQKTLHATSQFYHMISYRVMPKEAITNYEHLDTPSADYRASN